MKKEQYLILDVIVIQDVMVGSFVNASSIHSVYSSAAQEANEDQQSETFDNELADQPEPTRS
jgi:hypothetical protein